MTIEELEKKMAELDELQAETENAHAKLIAQFDELKAQNEEKPKPPHPRWKPEEEKLYYTINTGYACAGSNTWDGDNIDGDIYSLGFVFKTEAEAEFAIERLKVLAEMREWAGNWDDEFTLRYNENSGIETYIHVFPFKSYGEMRFATKEDAENCIKAVGKDRLIKYYFGVRDHEIPAETE